MSKQMFLVDTKGTGIGVFRDLILSRSGSVISTGTWVVSAATQVQCTRTGGGELLEHITPQLTGFTLAGNITINIWAYENAATANCGLRARIFRRTSLGVETEIPGSPFDKGVELGTTSAVQNWTATPSSGIVFATGDLLILRLYLVPVGGTMGSTETIAVIYGAGSAAISGDSYITISESPNYTVVFIISPAGGGVFHGSATVKTNNTYTGTGTATFGGTATAKAGQRFNGTGTAVFHGSAPEKVKLIYAANGTGIFGGTAAHSQGIVFIGTGKGIFAGSAGINAGFSFSATGGAVAGGSATVFENYTVVGSGSADLAGTADLITSLNFDGSGSLFADGVADVLVITKTPGFFDNGIVVTPWNGTVLVTLPALEAA